ncbi:hypothetical protein [Derxia lacustris]|uniref:hypothetical protein n=1 Tax=Derxia lacustris TaxID=764842 RepID=UPI000A17538C|nr:hypothetical protein [Derxia lacustris]
MLHLLSNWYPEDDPITREQAEMLALMLDGLLTEKALEGFLIVCSRLVDDFGRHRTEDLANIFRTDSPQGRLALLRSLEHVNDWIGGFAAYERRYPVTINPSNPAFPQLRIMGIETFEPRLYRLLDSRALVYGSEESIAAHIRRTGRLPPVPVQAEPVLRAKPLYHWCSSGKWPSPHASREALQILPDWSNCLLRASIPTANIENSAFVAFNGDKDPSAEGWKFYNYFFEPLAQDHPPLRGGGPQIGLDGAPPVELLEEWDEATQEWRIVWSAAG